MAIEVEGGMKPFHTPPIAKVWVATSEVFDSTVNFFEGVFSCPEKAMKAIERKFIEEHWRSGPIHWALCPNGTYHGEALGRDDITWKVFKEDVL